MVTLGNSWDARLSEEWEKPYYQKLRSFLVSEYRTREVYPKAEDLFIALRSVDLPDAKVVILGQDPYHGPGQAHGFAFSVQKDIQIPPSLLNIYKEIETDTGIPKPSTGSLTGWARQGVLLLNTVLSVRRGQPQSHKGMGWEILTDEILRQCNESEKPTVFMLWGRPARMKKQLVTNPAHLCLEAPHPSPLSAYNGFFGCKHFTKANTFLEQNGLEPIRWEENE